MESSNLNKFSPENDDALEARLRTHFSAPPLADDGFSQGVLAALPAPEPKASRLSRRYFCLGGLVAGVSITAVGLLTSGNSGSALGTLDQTLTLALGQLCTAPMALALGLVLFSAGFALRGQSRLLPRL